MCCTNSLVARLCSVFCKENLSGDWLSEKKELIKFFYKKITEAKNHAILSSISLLKMVQMEYREKISIEDMNFESIDKEIILPSALAIAIHDREMWNELRNETIWNELQEKNPLPVLKFDDDPLSFLLIFCDNIQEWGRPSESMVKDNEKRWKKFYLKNFSFNKTIGFDITIWTPNNTKCEKFFLDKQEQLKEIQMFLQQPSSVMSTFI